jgi:Ca2+-binding RTX toxin-like protein
MSGRFRLSALILSVLALGAFALVADLRPEGTEASASECPPGFRATTYEELVAEATGREEAGTVEAAEASRGTARYCLNEKHPESFFEMEAMANERAAQMYAPWNGVDGGAYPAALREREQIIASAPNVRGANSTWLPYGRGPLISNDARFPNVNGNGFVELAGRVDSLTYDDENDRLFATIGTGGVWMSTDLGQSWRSIGDSLPTQVIGAATWTPARGGRVVAVAGEPLMGGNTYTGPGAYWTDDLGKSWHKAKGVPDGIMGFQAVADPTNGRNVYVATTKGLFRSTDAGSNFQNVNLPTGPCAGNTDNQECLLANYVTDVVVQAPDGFGNSGGGVLAAVGYRAGARPYPQNTGVIESPCNGLFGSDTGAPGTFTNLGGDCGDSPSGFAPFSRIGRVELGIATGPDQNHDYVYAIVEDAELFRGGYQVIDAPEEEVGAGAPQSLVNGVYVTANFGTSWTQMANTDQIAYNPTTNSALFAVSPINPPGIQAWYNEWIQPDPTRQTAAGIPTRVTFGLEEVWQNRLTNLPQNGPSDFQVIGRYFSTESCILGVGGNITCPPNPAVPTTTHPDQHDAIWVPDGQGGVTLVVGNDGGVYTQHAAAGEELVNQDWGTGANDGFHTLLPYFAAPAKDGTVWYGLQDNGSGKIQGSDQRQFMTFGGDGFFTAVDPDNSNVAYSEVTNGNMRVTTDGGTTWRDMYPFTTGAKFSNPFVMDPLDANHLLTAGQQVVESTYGPETQQMDPGGSVCFSNCWEEVFDLGTGNGMSAVDLHGTAAYVGFCGPCGLVNATQPFKTGLATNIGGAQPPQPLTDQGWHIAAANGLPHRYINSVAIDPNDPNTVYVALGGYENRQWRPPGSFGDPNPNIGQGHVFVSHDAGETFTNISANLPDAPAFWVEPYRNQLVVGTQVGAFVSNSVGKAKTNKPAKFRWAALHRGMPVVPIASLQFSPGDRDVLYAATFGRGVYTVDLGGCGRKASSRKGNQIVGTQIRDRLRGGKKTDVICGKGGSDRISGKAGNDLLIGGGGKKTRDRLNGGAGNDLLRGQGGRDILKGGAGRDRLIGGGGRDVCFVGPGDLARGCERKRNA